MSGSRLFVCSLCQGGGHVIDSREAPRDGTYQVRRRYECEACQHRWSTIERQEDVLPRGQPTPLGSLSADEHAKLDKLVAHRIQQIAYRLRKGTLR